MSKLTPKAPGRPISKLDKIQSRNVLQAQHKNQQKAQAKRVGRWPHEVKATAAKYSPEGELLVPAGICTRVRKLKGL